MRAPLADGVAVTCTVQLAADARLETQLLVCEKSVALTPVIAMGLIVTGVEPVFVIVTGCAVDGVLTTALGNAMEEGVICRTVMPEPAVGMSRIRKSGGVTDIVG